MSEHEEHNGADSEHEETGELGLDEEAKAALGEDDDALDEGDDKGGEGEGEDDEIEALLKSAREPDDDAVDDGAEGKRKEEPDPKAELAEAEKPLLAEVEKWRNGVERIRLYLAGKVELQGYPPVADLDAGRHADLMLRAQDYRDAANRAESRLESVRGSYRERIERHEAAKRERSKTEAFVEVNKQLRSFVDEAILKRFPDLKGRRAEMVLNLQDAYEAGKLRRDMTDRQLLRLVLGKPSPSVDRKKGDGRPARRSSVTHGIDDVEDVAPSSSKKSDAPAGAEKKVSAWRKLGISDETGARLERRYRETFGSGASADPEDLIEYYGISKKRSR